MVAATIFFETFTMLAVGAALAALVLIVWYPHQLLLIGAAVGSTALLGIPTIPRVFQWMIQIVGVGKLNPTAGARFRHLGMSTILWGWGYLSIGWVFQGLSLWATLRALGAIPLDGEQAGAFQEMCLHTATVSLSVVAGFISQLPGGLGMREWVAGALMEPHYGPAMAMISAVIFRLVMLVSEVVISIILYVAGWRRMPKSIAEIEAELSTAANP